jgi:hypothetical protein
MKKDNTPSQDETSSEKMPEEFGGQKGPEPTRYGDWENKGRVSDF